MGRYIARRLLETIPLMLIISIFVFMFIHLIPGDPARTLAGVEATPEEIEAIREEFGLNDPLLKQYADYMIGLFKGDMGRSLKSNIPVTELIWSRFQFTIQLVCAGLVWAPFLGIFIGVMCHQTRDLGGPGRYVLSHLRTFCSRFLAGPYGDPVLLCKDGHAPVRRPGVLEEPGAAVFSNGYRYHGYPCQIFPFLHA